MALLGLLVADQGKTMTVEALNILLLANPADVYRLLNLTGFSNVSLFAGMAGLADQLNIATSVLAAALVAWTVVPLSLAAMVFARREL